MLLQMFPYLLFLFIINLIANLPFSFSADDSRFTACSLDFECGNTRIGYPFWGNDRAEFCGLPGYELRCTEESVYIRIETEEYNVLDFTEVNNTIRIATTNIWDDNCPTRYVNVSLPINQFSYLLPVTQNITLFYGCPIIPELHATNRFNCTLDTTSGANYFWLDSVPPPQDLSRCNLTIVLPVLGALVPSFRTSQTTVEDVLKNGFELEYHRNMFCENCEGSGGQCGRDLNTSLSTCYCSDGPYIERCTPAASKSIAGKTIVIGISSGTGSILLMSLLIILYKRRRSAPQILSWKKKTRISIDFEAFLKNHMSHYPKRYNFKDVKTMTKAFKDKLGQGGYGTVFKGTLNDGQFVAVKVLTKTKGNGEEFINEVASISRTSHVNIVGLLGYCFDGSKRALIYEFMPNGSLDKYIYGEKSSEEYSQLEWETVYQIAVGTARGLEYLHRGCSTRILHFDIKPHNILLDKDFCPKISDFGLARLCPTKESVISMLGARGTAGYIAPEVFSRSFGGISHKSDVYSYGMMILEMVGRRKNIDIGVNHTSEIYFPSWIYKRIELDEDLGLHGVVTQTAGELTKKMILVGLWCIQTNPQDRPSMGKVLEMLENSIQVLSLPPKPYLCSPPRVPTGSSVN